MRYFSAIPLQSELKDKVRDLTRGKLPIPYVNTSNLHITLNFFGELDTDSTKKLFDIFVNGAGEFSRFEIVFDKILKVRQQIHITLKPNEQLKKLHQRMDKFFRSQGFALQDREYYPHMKLGNLHMDNVMNKQRKMENFPNDELSNINFIADKVVLYSSELLLHHPKHTPLIEVLFK